ncbi:MAG: hypothetical protein P8J91_11995 [Pirellulaceae bacterium]|nr:hypothetical protein [Pirellulaceae bacterium]MDG2104461.1 hypothetical protein [Pirellulaceae bacterium]
MIKAFVALLMITMIIIGVAWYFMNQASEDGLASSAQEQRRVEQGFLETRQELNDKLEEYKRRKSTVEEKIIQFDSLKQKATEDLRELGVTTAEQLEQNPDAKRKYRSIRQYMEDIQKLSGDVVLFNDAISAIENGLEELDRKLLLEEVGVDDITYRQLRTVVKDIDSRLDKPESTLEKLETQKTLDAILGEPVGSGQ